MGLPALKNQSLSLDRSELGKADTLRYNILSYVVENNYERAIGDLEKYLNKDSEFPSYRSRVERYINHAIDLVHAIKTKKTFPGMTSLTVSKQQEINDKCREHFNELQTALKKVENIERDLKVGDIRSTVIFLRTLSYCLVILFTVGFALELHRGLLKTSLNVVDDGFSKISDLVFGIDKK